MNTNTSQSKTLRGFSLVELLVAVSVLVILGWLISQVTVSVTRMTKQSNRIIDTASQVRLAFDRIGMDLAGLVKRSDVDFTTNDVFIGTKNILLFLSNVSSAGSSTGISTSNNRGISVVAYRVTTHSDNNNMPGLLRAGKAIPWKTVGTAENAKFMGLQSNGLPMRFTDLVAPPLVGFPAGLLPGVSDFDVLAPGVIRMVVGFQLYPDNNAVELSDGTNPIPNQSQGQIVYSPPIRWVTPVGGGTAVKYVDLSRISAVVVGLVAIDLNSQLLASASQLGDLSGAFNTPGNNVNQTPVQAWAPIANKVNSMPATVPLPVRQAVRVYEHFFPITPFTAKGP